MIFFEPPSSWNKPLPNFLLSLSFLSFEISTNSVICKKTDLGQWRANEKMFNTYSSIEECLKRNYAKQSPNCYIYMKLSISSCSSSRRFSLTTGLCPLLYHYYPPCHFKLHWFFHWSEDWSHFVRVYENFFSTSIK